MMIIQAVAKRIKLCGLKYMDAHFCAFRKYLSNDSKMTGEKDMIGTCKKLVTDIQREAEPEKNLPEYVSLLERQYNCYATVKGSMNYYTMKEVCDEQEDQNTDVCKYFSILTKLLERFLVKREAVDEEGKNAIRQLRDNVEYKMHILTAYTDVYEIYEYILNRVEMGVKGTVSTVDAKGLSEKMFAYVFSENDTVVINSKLQLMMAQLPVRMTKNKFYDIVSNTLNIYEGGETSSVDAFVDMLRESVLIQKPKGFEQEYPYLYHVYCDLAGADYTGLTESAFDDLSAGLNQAASIIKNEVSAFMLLQEVINDVYTILLTIDASYEENRNSTPGYVSACNILESCVRAKTVEHIPDEIMDEFISIEGVQERVYESIMILETVFDDIRIGKAELAERLGLTDTLNRLDIVGKLLSTSLFIDLDKAAGETTTADHAYITEKKDSLIAELAELFDGVKKPVYRSMMCKLLAAMPVFMNSQQEIRDYFDYVIENCRDDSELAACSKLIGEMIEE